MANILVTRATIVIKLFTEGLYPGQGNEFITLAINAIINTQ